MSGSSPKRRFAENTDVPVERSLAEIERLLGTYGCNAFQRGWQDVGQVGRTELLSFETRSRRIRFSVTIPPRATFRDTPTSQRRSDKAIEVVYEQERRRLWRVLYLSIKAKLVAVDSGLLTFEDEFLAYTVLPDHSTVGEWAGPQLDRIIASGALPPLLPAAPGPGAVLGLGPGQLRRDR